ncbi:xylulokinase [Spirochaetia bacterium]|nr:xylulokinase [Spirochaetia bacterium]
MSNTLLLAIDIGTSSFKSALWDLDGNRIAFAAVSLAMSGDDGGRHEAESAQWLRAFEECCRRLDSPASAGRAGALAAVKIIVISGNGPSLTPVLAEPSLGAGGLCLSAAPARLWLDRRATAAAAEVSALMGAYVDPCFYLPKALGIKNDESELYERTKFFLGCPEYLACALTGEARTVFPSEGFDRWFWNAEILEKLKLNAEKFPPFIRPGDIYGTIIPSVAARLGFAHNVPVAAGGPDFFAAILGAGVISPGQVCDRAGTSEGINVCTEKQIIDGRLMSYGHPVQPFWNLSGIISTTGKAVEWGRGLLGIESYADFYALAETAEAGAGGLVFLPYLAGERAPVWDPAARGVLRGLGLSSGRAEFARSVLEGICFAIRDVITVMEETGAAVGELRIAGRAGADENGIFNQIKADITGKEVLVMAQKEAELAGLAIIGACALGSYASFAEAAAALVRVEKRLEPDAKKAALYEGLFQKYRETYTVPRR